MSDYISQEVLTNILQRLTDVNDLLRCRKVSKQWRTVIDSPEFITNHLQLSLTDSNPGVMLLQREKDPILYLKNRAQFLPKAVQASRISADGFLPWLALHFPASQQQQHYHSAQPFNRGFSISTHVLRCCCQF
ncbi:hypothetical protein LINPERHAP1_LOCUS16754 [Linum perenne]